VRTCEAPVRRCVQSFTRWQKDPKVFRRTRYAGFRRKRRPDIIPLNLQDSGFALRGSSASVAGASIARGCPPRTSPPPAADLRAEARTHFLVAKSALLGTPTGKGKEIRKRKNTENET
jgi:hypothetical protein